MKRLEVLLAPLMLAAVLSALFPQLAAQAPAPSVTFSFANPALEPAHYTLLIHEDGTGHYHSDPGNAVGGGAQPLDRDIAVADPLRRQLFALARKQHFFAATCESKQKNLAFTGTKTLSYAGPEGTGSCTFNYPRDGQVETVSGQLIAVANTLEEGSKLESLFQHDKLGLDAEVETLVTEQADGRALEIANIAPVLRTIAGSGEVLNRTRSRAEALLASGNGTK